MPLASLCQAPSPEVEFGMLRGERESIFTQFLFLNLRMTVLGHGLIFQLVLASLTYPQTCTYDYDNNDAIILQWQVCHAKKKKEEKKKGTPDYCFTH